jgi:hypothetical protein
MAHIEECNSAFGVFPSSDSSSNFSFYSSTDSVPRTTSSCDTSMDGDRMPDLMTISDSSSDPDTDASDPLSSIWDDADSPSNMDAITPSEVLPKDVDWSSVRAFLDEQIPTAAAVVGTIALLEPKISLLDSGCTQHITPY